MSFQNYDCQEEEDVEWMNSQRDIEANVRNSIESLMGRIEHLLQALRPEVCKSVETKEKKGR